MASKFRLNQYNWFGQKLLAQHQYGEIARLRQYLDASQRQVGEHLHYLHSIALMKTSTHLDEIVFTIQRLNFYKNSQYFQLMCQCLLYLGNYDSVVALCKQIIGKEIDDDFAGFTSAVIGTEAGVEGTKDKKRGDNNSADDDDDADESAARTPGGGANNLWSLESSSAAAASYESVELRKFLATISRNNLIKEPRLWLIFGLSLEFQRQFKDANVAYRLAAKLASNNKSEIARRRPSSDDKFGDYGLATAPQTCISNYYAPHVRYANFCLERRADIKSAQLALDEAISAFPQNHALNPLLALVVSSQAQSGQASFARALEIIAALESHNVAYRNPSLGYNNLALRCKRRAAPAASFLAGNNREIGDEPRNNLDYLLIRSHVSINGLLQDSQRSGLFYKTNIGSEQQDRFQLAALNQMDKLIDALRNSDSSCWSSAALWNNLGLCYLIKRRLVACLSCLLKSQQLKPLDWRVNYNLAVAYLHVGLAARALVCLLAARRLAPKSSADSPMLATMAAICLDKLRAGDEARRLYLQTMQACKLSQAPVPVFALVNYLAYVHRVAAGGEEQNSRLKLRLLDQLEQNWLQRNQNDPQFNAQLMELARRIGEETFAELKGRPTRKTYAWTKSASFQVAQNQC